MNRFMAAMMTILALHACDKRKDEDKNKSTNSNSSNQTVADPVRVEEERQYYDALLTKLERNGFPVPGPGKTNPFAGKKFSPEQMKKMFPGYRQEGQQAALLDTASTTVDQGSTTTTTAPTTTTSPTSTTTVGDGGTTPPISPTSPPLCTNQEVASGRPSAMLLCAPEQPPPADNQCPEACAYAAAWACAFAEAWACASAHAEATAVCSDGTTVHAEASSEVCSWARSEFCAYSYAFACTK